MAPETDPEGRRCDGARVMTPANKNADLGHWRLKKVLMQRVHSSPLSAGPACDPVLPEMSHPVASLGVSVGLERGEAPVLFQMPEGDYSIHLPH